MKYKAIARVRFCERNLTSDQWEEYIEGWEWRENREYSPDYPSSAQKMGYEDAIKFFG